MQHALQSSGIAFDSAAANSTIRVKRGVNATGHSLTYLLNYSSADADATYAGPAAHDLLNGSVIKSGQALHIKPWDLVIAASDDTATSQR